MIRPNLLALLTLLSMGPLSVACAPSLCSPVKAIKAAPALAVQPAAVIVNAYGARYQENTADEVQNELIRQNNELQKQNAELLRAILAALTSQPNAGTGTSPAPAPIEDAASLTGGQCGRCHKASLAASKGSKIVLLEDSGKVPPMSIVEQRAIDKAIDSGAMPPGGKLSVTQKQAIKSFFKPKE